jgi:hypothetical protein
VCRYYLLAALALATVLIKRKKPGLAPKRLITDRSVFTYYLLAALAPATVLIKRKKPGLAPKRLITDPSVFTYYLLTVMALATVLVKRKKPGLAPKRLVTGCPSVFASITETRQPFLCSADGLNYREHFSRRHFMSSLLEGFAVLFVEFRFHS